MFGKFTNAIFYISFVQIEHDIGEWWQENLWGSMLEAGREEKRLAEERGEDDVQCKSV